MVYKKAHKSQNLLFNCLGALIACAILVTGAELSVFNVNYYSTKNYTPENITGKAIECPQADGTLMFPTGEAIDLLEINKETKNVQFTLGDDAPLSTKVTIHITDDANKYLLKTPQRTIYSKIKSSQSINLHTAGISETLSIQFDGKETYIPVKDISINVPRDFDFSFTRVAVLIGLIMLLYIFRPSSPIYGYTLDKAKDILPALTVGFVALQVLVIITTSTMNPAFWGISYSDGEYVVHSLSTAHHNQYDELAQAILQGKTYIDNNDVPQSLKEMENPYDRVARYYNEHATGDKYGWDVAFFNGHYYVYFGIVPLLLMYLPCRLLFEAPFPSALGIVIFAILFSIAVFKLLGLICEKYFKKTSVGTYLLLSMAFINCCGAMFLVKRPDFYSVPIITGMTFIVTGLYLWLKGRDCTRGQNLYFLLGSLCCALAVGCRPQFVLLSALVIPVFIGYFFKNMHIKEKSGIFNLVALGIPYVVVASGIMYYNYIRFGSPFDFGSAYNLTTNDVTRRGFVMGRTGLGLFTYLLQPPQITGVFPFLKAVSVDTNYVGRTVMEKCFGGMITSLPLLWFSFALPKVKDVLREKKLLLFSCMLFALSIVMVIADTQAGGLLQRYYSDFGFTLFLGAVLVILALCEKVKSKDGRKNLNTLIYFFTILSVIYTILLVFSVSDATIDVVNPTLFGKISHLVQFWL
ncbi:MAG: hypothetical protein J6Q83_08265 [Clostridia bacterium]|nr:hypothetical protein [Clostridia bacterium]